MDKKKSYGLTLFYFLEYSLTVVVYYFTPPPRIGLDGLQTGQFFLVSFPYTMTKIHKKRNLKKIGFCKSALIYTLYFCPDIYIFQFCLDKRSLNENDIKNDDQCIFSDLCQKTFPGRVNRFEFEGGT